MVLKLTEAWSDWSVFPCNKSLLEHLCQHRNPAWIRWTPLHGLHFYILRSNELNCIWGSRDHERMKELHLYSFGTFPQWTWWAPRTFHGFTHWRIQECSWVILGLVPGGQVTASVLDWLLNRSFCEWWWLAHVLGPICKVALHIPWELDGISKLKRNISVDDCFYCRVNNFQPRYEWS